MPNTPAMIGAGVTALCAGRFCSVEQMAVAQRIFSTVGRTVVVDEKHMDAVTGLSGSGPAFLYIIIEALAEAGVNVGLPRDVATLLAAQTTLGSARMVLETGYHPALLKDQVTTPAGLYGRRHSRTRRRRPACHADQSGQASHHAGKGARGRQVGYGCGVSELLEGACGPAGFGNSTGPGSTGRSRAAGAVYGAAFMPTSSVHTFSWRVPTSCTRISSCRFGSTHRAWYTSELLRTMAKPDGAGVRRSRNPQPAGPQDVAVAFCMRTGLAARSRTNHPKLQPQWEVGVGLCHRDGRPRHRQHRLQPDKRMRRVELVRLFAHGAPSTRSASRGRCRTPGSKFPASARASSSVRGSTDRLPAAAQSAGCSLRCSRSPPPAAQADCHGRTLQDAQTRPESPRFAPLAHAAGSRGRSRSRERREPGSAAAST